VDILGDDEVAVGSTEFIVLSETDRILPKFVYYTVRRPEIRQFAIKRMTGTSGRQRVPLDIFDNIKISLPPVQEQKAIVSVLDAIDSKIETNHRINEILENISFALFKSWFIDFEPYKNFKNTGDGEIPVNFKLGSINDIVDLKNGSSRPESEGQIPVYGGNGITDYTSEISESSEVVVIGRVGAFCGNVHRTYRSSWISDNAILAKSKNEKISINYIYQLMKSMNLKRLRHGTSQPLISQTDIYEEEVIIPPIDEIQESEHMTEYMFDYICKNRRENKSLRQLRNTLLPKLMSGEIRVDDIKLDELEVDSEV
jgi:type I restriction enzyme S subunit